MRLCTLVAGIGIVFTSCVPAADAGVRFGDGSSDPAESIQPERRPTPGTQPERTPTRRQPAPTRRSPSQPTPAVNPGDAPSSLGANLQIESMLPARSVAAFGGRMILRGEGFHKDDVHVLFAGVPLEVVERKEGRGGRQDHVIVQLPSSGDGPASGPLRLAKGPRGGPFTVENTRTVHATFQLVNESELVPEFELLSATPSGALEPVDHNDAWPMDDRGRPYEGVYVNLHVRIHNLPGTTLRELRSDLKGPWVPAAKDSSCPPYDHADGGTAVTFEYNTLDYTFRQVITPPDPFTLRIETRTADGTLLERDTHAAIATAPRIVYTVRDTYALQRFMNMKLKFGRGAVDGIVLTQGNLDDFEVNVPGADEFALTVSRRIGLVNHEGDLTIRLVSGPTPGGATSWWVGDTLLLRNGWSIVQMQWEEDFTLNGKPADLDERGGDAPFVSRTGSAGNPVTESQADARNGTRILAGWQTLPAWFTTDRDRRGTARRQFNRFQGTAHPFDGIGGPMARADPGTLDIPRLRLDNRREHLIFQHRPAMLLPAQGVLLRSTTAVGMPGATGEVTATLKSVTFLGPPGAKWEDAFYPVSIDPEFNDMHIVRVITRPDGLPSVSYTQEPR